eukprot:432192_1
MKFTRYQMVGALVLITFLFMHLNQWAFLWPRQSTFGPMIPISMRRNMTYDVISYESKVFEMGLPKTGTTSLGRALTILGFNTIGWSPSLHDHYKITGNISNVLLASKRYEAFHDGPWHVIEPNVWAQVYPNAKFIFLVREESSWLRSMESHFSPKYNVHDSEKKRLNYDWIQNREKAISDAIGMRNRKQKSVFEFFKDDPTKLLIMNTSELGWEPLCQFLNKTIPSKPFPFTNKSKRKTQE